MSIWTSADAYETYVGRWSRHVARVFLVQLAAAPGGRWLDAGCGTGALTARVLATAAPRQVVSIDTSAAYVGLVRATMQDERASVVLGDAQRLPFETAVFDVVVSGLMLNFLPEPGRSVAEMARITRPGGVVAAYVWDYAGEMQLMRRFWDAVAELFPAHRDLDEGQRFPLCRPEPLTRLFRDAGLAEVKTVAIDVPTVFRDFDDFWLPFLGGQGPAPAYAVSLSDTQRSALRERIRIRLPAAADGSIALMARAWAVWGTVGRA